MVSRIVMKCRNCGKYSTDMEGSDFNYLCFPYDFRNSYLFTKDKIVKDFDDFVRENGLAVDLRGCPVTHWCDEKETVRGVFETVSCEIHERTDEKNEQEEGAKKCGYGIRV